MWVWAPSSHVKSSGQSSMYVITSGDSSIILFILVQYIFIIHSPYSIICLVTIYYTLSDNNSQLTEGNAFLKFVVDTTTRGWCSTSGGRRSTSRGWCSTSRGRRSPSRGWCSTWRGWCSTSKRVVLNFERMVLNFGRATLNFERMVLNFERMAINFERVVLNFERMAINSKSEFS